MARYMGLIHINSTHFELDTPWSIPNLSHMPTLDERTFKQCYDQYFAAVWKFVYRIVRSRDAASDVAQSAFITLWEKRASIPPGVNVRAYIFAIARNIAINTVRHDVVVERAASEAANQGIALVAPAGTTPDEDLQSAELNDAAVKAIDALPERQRSALLLRWQEGMTNAEIARVLGVGEPAVSQLLARATNTVRAALCELLEGSND